MTCQEGKRVSIRRESQVVYGISDTDMSRLLRKEGGYQETDSKDPKTITDMSGVLQDEE